MADQNSKKKKTSGKSGSGRKSGKSNGGSTAVTRRSSDGRRKKDTKRNIARKKSFLHAEIAGILSIFIGIFLLLVNVGLLGSAGEWLRSLGHGLFGQASFLPALLVIAAAFLFYTEQGNYLLPHKLCSLAAVLPVMSAILHLMFGGDLVPGKGEAAVTAGMLYEQCSKGAPGGGVVGGTIANLLHGVIGYVGAYLVLIVLLVICVVILTEKSFVNIARSSAEKTASAVRAGAGRTLEAARSGRERYSQMHRENQIRKDARREEEKLRRLEAGFEDLGLKNPASLSNVTISGADAGAAAAEAEMYASYGRDIIGEEQPGLDSLNGVKAPLFRPRVPVRPADQETNYDTQVMRDVFVEGPRTPRAEVVIKQIDYNADDVPFDETEEEVYQSYAHILNAGQMNIEAARKAGFAVGRNEAWDTGVQNPAEENTAGWPDSFAAFKTGDDGTSAAEYDTAGADTAAAAGFDAAEAYDAGAGHGNAAESFVNEGFETSHSIAYQGFGNKGFEEVPAENDEYAGYESENRDIPAPDDYDEYEDQPDEEETEVYNTANGQEMEVDRYEANEIMTKKGFRPKSSAAGGRQAESSGSGSGSNTGSKAENKTGTGTEAPSGQDAAPKPKPKPKPRPYVFPPVGLLERGESQSGGNRSAAEANARKLEQVMRDFGIGAKVTNVIRGPRVSRYVMIPDTGVKVSRITSLQEDIKMALAARELRILAPIPGESAVGIEVPNEESQTVRFRDILESEEFKNAKSKLSWGIGLDIQGRPVVGDISKMPHLLVAGTTGSGKSVGINSLIMSILYRSTPEEVRMILIDPKVVELSVYNGIPHLLTEVVTKPERAVSALNWAVQEMQNRYKLFQASGTRNISGYNQKVQETNAALPEDSEERLNKLPYILIIIDELAELMMHSKKDIEGSIVSLTQLARAAGMHLVVATQRPSVDVITGLIKSNIPSRIAYRLPSPVDSRTILDAGGAETLLGNGDMLYKPGDKNHPDRIQGAFLSDSEVEKVVEYIRKHNARDDSTVVDEAISRQVRLDTGDAPEAEDPHSDRDEYYAEAGRHIINTKKATIGALQRKFKIGFNRAARIMDQLHEDGVVGDGEGTKERQILMTMEQFEELL